MAEENILRNLSGIQEGVLLSQYTTFKIGGPARYFFVAKNKEEIIRAVKAARKCKVPFFILGGGSNLLVSDEGFNGLVIKMHNTGYMIQNTKVVTGAGVSLSKLVAESVNVGLTGLEWAAGIPGTIGGAIVGNAGAYGRSISGCVESVKTISFQETNSGVNSGAKLPRGSLAPETLFEEKQYNNTECGFEYRGSRFSAEGGSAVRLSSLLKSSGGKESNEIILSVELKLRKGDKEKSQAEIKNLLLQRRAKNPPYPSAGCVFKNIRIADAAMREVAGEFITKTGIEIPKEKIRSGKFAAGYLIDKCGLKGKQIGRAKISDEHANFIVNLGSSHYSSGEVGGTKAKDVVALINLCKEKVKQKFGIELEEEIRYVGF